MTTATPTFRRGAEAAEEASHRPSFNRIKYLTLKDGESCYIRMLSGHEEGMGLVTVEQHNGSPTRPAPANYQGNWPQTMSAICRNDPAFSGMYSDCFLCNEFARTGNKRDFKPATRVWGLGVVRKPQMVEGREVGMSDSVVEVEIDGVKMLVPEIVKMNFAWGNFWASLANTYIMNGTWLDVDMFIRRSGTGTDTDYKATPREAVTFDTQEPWRERQIQHEANPERFPDPGPAFDVRLPEHAGRYLHALGISPETLANEFGNNPQRAFNAEVEKIVVESSSDEYFARFFDTRMAQPSNQGGTDGGTVVLPEVEAPSGQPSNDELAAMAARVQSSVPGYGTAAS